MLSEQEKKEKLADGLSPQRRQAFREAEQRKPKIVPSFDDYISFLMDVQKIMPFKHNRVTTPADKNLL